MAVRAYVRVSTEEQALSGYSLGAQGDGLRAVASARGWSIARLYTDDGFSAKDTNRPGLQALLDDAEPGDVVLVYKLDRLTRSVRDLDDLLREFERRGLLLQSATEQFETTTASGRLFLRIVTEIAQWERETIAERTAMGKRQKVELGEWPGGPVPYGYRAEPSGKVKGGKRLLRLVPDPVRGPLVAAMFDRYLSGHGMRAVCQWLNDELAARTSGGARWRVSSLARLLTNPLYCGDVVYGRRSRGPERRVAGTHAPLVSREVFERVQRLFAARRTMAPRQATSQYPLAGVAVCGLCGGSIDVVRQRGVYRYRCRNYANGVGCRGAGSIAGEAAESLVLEAMARLPLPVCLPAFFRQCEAALAGGGAGAAGETARLRAELAECGRAVQRWDRAYETGAIPLAVYRQKVAPLTERVGQIERRLAESPPPGAEALADPASLAVDLPWAWQHLCPPERKLLLQRLVGAFGLQIRLGPANRVQLGPGEPAAAPGRAGGRTPAPRRASGRAGAPSTR